MNSTLFYSAANLLAPDSVILPGNYGRILRAIGPRHHSWTREQTLERIRLADYPDKPSRLDCCFACPSLHALKEYLCSLARRPPGDPIWPVAYEVRKADEIAPEHNASFDIDAGAQSLPDFEVAAHLYWSEGRWRRDRGTEGCEEVITASPLIIVRRVEF